MSDRAKRVEESDLLNQLNEQFYLLYEAYLQTLVSGVPELIEKSRHLLEAFSKVVSAGQSEKALDIARSSLYNVFRAVLILHGVLPDPIEEKTVLLARHMVVDPTETEAGSADLEDPAKDFAFPGSEFREITVQLKTRLQQSGCLDPAKSILVQLGNGKTETELNINAVVDDISKLLAFADSLGKGNSPASRTAENK